jgi:hypothetical protein
MPNTIQTPTWMARKVLVVASNTVRFIGAITKKLAEDFIVDGVKVGAQIQVRLPWRAQTTKGQAIQIQPLVDTLVPITITDQANIAWGWSSFSGTLEIQDAEDRYVEPAGVQLANTYDADALARVYQDVFSVEGTPGTVPNANSTYLNAAARLTNFAAPTGAAADVDQCANARVDRERQSDAVQSAEAQIPRRGPMACGRARRSPGISGTKTSTCSRTRSGRSAARRR